MEKENESVQERDDTVYIKTGNEKKKRKRKYVNIFDMSARLTSISRKPKRKKNFLKKHKCHL